MIKKLLLALAATLLIAGAAEAQSRIKVGVLTCDVEAGIGLIVVSSKDVACEFERRRRLQDRDLHGTIRKLGLDVGFTAVTKIDWLVFSAADTPVRARLPRRHLCRRLGRSDGRRRPRRQLAGRRLAQGFALQPWSVQGQAGLNLSLAFAGLTLALSATASLNSKRRPRGRRFHLEHGRCVERRPSPSDRFGFLKERLGLVPDAALPEVGVVGALLDPDPALGSARAS